MVLEEAIQIISNAYPNFKFISVVDYDNYFVFNIVPPNHNIETDGEWMGGLVAVDKVFKVTMHFVPFQHNLAAYAKAAETNIKYF